MNKIKLGWMIMILVIGQLYYFALTDVIYTEAQKGSWIAVISLEFFISLFLLASKEEED